MVTYMEPQRAPSYMSVKVTCRTLRKPNFMLVTHAQPSLSNISKWDLNFGEPSHASGTTRLGRNFLISAQNQNAKLTHCSIYVQFEQYLSHRQNERRAHPSWAPTKEPTMSCWRYTPSPKQDRFQDFLEAICPDFQPVWIIVTSLPTHISINSHPFPVGIVS